MTMSDTEASRPTVPVYDLLPGDWIDLADDPYADPNGDGTCACEPGCDHWYSFAFEYAVVEAVDVQHGHVSLEVDGGSFTFPADHRVPLIRRDLSMRAKWERFQQIESSKEAPS